MPTSGQKPRAITSTLSGAHKRRRYEKAGTTPSEALEARRRKEFELMGRAVLEQGKQIARTDQTGMTIESAAADYQEQLVGPDRPMKLTVTDQTRSEIKGKADPLRVEIFRYYRPCSSKLVPHLCPSPAVAQHESSISAG